MSTQAFGGAPPPAQAPCCLLLPWLNADEQFVSWARARAQDLAGVEVVAPDAETWTAWREGAGGWAGLPAWCAAQVRFAAAVLLERPDGTIGRGAGDIAQAFARTGKPVYALRVVGGGPALVPVAGLDRVPVGPDGRADYVRTYTVVAGQRSASGMLPVFASAPSPAGDGAAAAPPPVAEWRRPPAAGRRRAVHHNERDVERRRQFDAIVEDQRRRDQLRRAREREVELERENARLRRLARRAAREPDEEPPAQAQPDAEDATPRPVRRLYFSPADGDGEKKQ